MPRNGSDIGEAILRLLDGWEPARAERARRRWAAVGMASIGAPQKPAVEAGGRGRTAVRCTVCGDRDIRIRGRGRGRPASTCGDPVCVKIRRIAVDSRRGEEIDWESVYGTVTGEVESEAA